jgi:hypothetical protein
MLILAVLLWAGAIGIGMKRMLDYQERPGRPASMPAAWPTSSAVHRSADRLTLLVFAHPRCSCTRATLSDLARLMARAQGRLSAQLMFVVPDGLPMDRERSELWSSARGIPGLAVHIDSSGVEANRFGVSTSGQVLVYDPAGHLLFAGGITPGRGHEGDNAGVETIERLVDGRPVGLSTTPVFGCGLKAPVAAVPRKETERWLRK